MTHSRRRLGLLALAAVLSACTAKPTRTSAAEPAKAPEPTAAPAGVVVPVGREPEGLVAVPFSNLVAVGVRDPDQLVLVDVARRAVVARVDLPGHVRHLAVTSSGLVVVPLEQQNRVLLFDPRTRLVVQDTPVGEHPHGAAGLPDGRWVSGDEFGGVLSVVDRAGSVQTVTGFRQPGGLAASGRAVAVVDVGTYLVTVLDLETLRPVARRKVGAGPTHVVADRRGDFIVVDTRGGALVALRRSGSRLVVRADERLAGTPYGIAYDAERDTIWVTLTARNEVVRVDPLTLKVTGRFRTGQQANTVAVVGGVVVVANRKGASLQLIPG